MTDHNIVAAFIPLVERPPQALADNAAHENADLFAQDQSVFTQHNFSKKFYPVLAANVPKPVDTKGGEHETRGRTPRHARRAVRHASRATINPQLVTRSNAEHPAVQTTS